MRNISMLFVLLIIAATPVLADVNQKADLTGENAIEIKVGQTAWNYGNGDIYQNIGVDVIGNYQVLTQDSIVMIGDSEYDGDINNTINGLNMIRVDLDQFAESHGSGITGQGIDILVSQNIQDLDQEVVVLIG
jgi:hypothetical protein